MSGTRILPIPMGVGPSPSEFYTKTEIDTMLQSYAKLVTTDLVNYYLKTETYTQAEVQQLVGQITSFDVVATLPVSNIKTNVIYLLGPIGTGADKYEEYIYSNSIWVKIGETSIDLSGYQTLLSTTNKLDADYVSDGTTNKVFTATEQTKLANIAAGAEVNVQADWNEDDSNSDAYIQNKPTIPAAQVNSDWNASSGVAEILNKPNLATVATTGAYSDLSGTPTIPDDLNDLTDVNITSPTNGQVMKYNATTQKWENGTGGGGGGNVVELTQQQYDALVTPDPDTTYIITDADAIDMDDYATQTDMETVQTALAGKADKQSVTANTGNTTFAKWNEQGVITGAGSSITTKSLNINGNSNTFYGLYSSSVGPIYGPTTAGSANQIPVSSGSGAPSWANLDTLTGGLKFWLGTQQQYDALAPNYDSSTLYVISD